MISLCPAEIRFRNCKMIFLGNRTIKEIRHHLGSLFSQNQKEALGVKGIKENLVPLLFSYIGKRYEINGGGIYLYRMRLNEEKGKPVDFFHHTDQLGAPLIPTWKGRCNEIGERVLYCSDHPMNCLAELKGLKAGDLVTFITYEVRVGKKIEPVSFVGVDLLQENANLLRSLIADFYGDLKNDPRFKFIKLVDDFMSNEFHLNLDETNNDNVYNATIAWKQLCFERSHSRCLIYPSAVSQLRTANLAIDPDFANDILVPVEANRYRIVEIRSGGTDFVMDHDSQAMLSGYGAINWESIPILREYITHRRVSDNPFEIAE